MEQFNLDIWLQDRSRKVVTRDGMPVRIVCWDSPNKEFPIVGFVERDLFTWADDGKVIYGGECEDKNDLFFADEKNTNKILDELESYFEKTPKEQVEKDWKEIQDWYAQHFTEEKYNDEDELTEFEKQLGVYIYYPRLSCGFNEEEKKYIKDAANTLLDLARKELIEELSDDNFTIDFAISKGKQDALKALPKWKKATEDKDFDRHVLLLEDDRVVIASCVYKDELYIELNNLKTLPKEE